MTKKGKNAQQWKTYSNPPVPFPFLFYRCVRDEVLTVWQET